MKVSPIDAIKDDVGAGLFEDCVIVVVRRANPSVDVLVVEVCDDLDPVVGCVCVAVDPVHCLCVNSNVYNTSRQV